MTDPSLRVAGAPITWGVCEVPGWGHQMAADRVLGEMRSIGLRATELGPEGFLPEDSAASLLAAHGLQLVAGFVAAVLHDEEQLDQDFPTIAASIETIASLGGSVLVVAASTGREGYEGDDRLDAEGWAALARGLDRVEAAAGERGLRVAVHPHHGTVVERREDVERLLEVSTVGLCLDTGHVVVGGGDPVAIAAAAGPRVLHVHLKDVDTTIAERVEHGGLGYHDAVREGLYRPLGDGDVDVLGVLRSLAEARYVGWYVLEHDAVLEREPDAEFGPLQDARRSLAFLERAWEEVGAPTGRTAHG